MITYRLRVCVVRGKIHIIHRGVYYVDSAIWILGFCHVSDARSVRHDTLSWIYKSCSLFMTEPSVAEKPMQCLRLCNVFLTLEFSHSSNCLTLVPRWWETSSFSISLTYLFSCAHLRNSVTGHAHWCLSVHPLVSWSVSLLLRVHYCCLPNALLNV